MGIYEIILTLTLDDWTNIATIIGVFIAVGALLFTACQINQNTKISRGQFWLELEKMFSRHDDTHLKLRPGGEWSTENAGPENPSDWVKVEDYMGLFEHCEILLQKKLIDEETFRSIFSYRLQNIVANKIIVNAKLIEERNQWVNFLELRKRMKI